jgi:hypothetical protein
MYLVLYLLLNSELPPKTFDKDRDMSPNVFPPLLRRLGGPVNFYMVSVNAL